MAPGLSDPAAPAVTFGETLRRARTTRGLTLAQVAAQTHIRADYLQALEQQEVTALPERPFARSFLTQYAQELGLDPAPLLADLDQLLPTPARTATLTPQPQGTRSPGPARSSLGAVLPWLLGGLVLLGGAGYLTLRNQQTPAGVAAPTSTAPVQSVPTSVNLTVNSVPAGARVLLDNRDLGRTPVQSFPVEARQGAVLRVESAGRLSFKGPLDLRTGRNLRVRLMPAGLGPSVVTDVATGQVQESLPVPQPSAPPVPVKGVSLTFVGPSWVRVTAPSGESLFEGILPAGTTRTYDRGVTIRAGNAAAVRISVDGSDPQLLGTEGQVVTRTF